MLLQFNFENFKSFKALTSLDLTATKITEHNQRIINASGEKILPCAAIFGANASGKSNVLEAFRYMSTYVINSFTYGGDSVNSKETGNLDKPKYTPFLFEPTQGIAPSSFEVYFTLSGEEEVHNNRIYNYGFTLNKDRIIEEWLNVKAKTSKTSRRIFYRDSHELDLSGLPAKTQENIKISLEPETLVVSLGAKLKIAPLKLIRDWFLNTTCLNFAHTRINTKITSLLPPDFAKSKEVQQKLVKYLASFDSSITGFRVTESRGIHKTSPASIQVETIHTTATGEPCYLPLEEESDGTLKMFSLYAVLKETMEHGGILFVDELNASLHPLLVRSFLLTFLNPEINITHAQIVFTTHDSWQLSNNLLRRDEIWFTSKDENGISTLYSLAEFSDTHGTKIRKDESYEKNYLLGKYGAIPSLKYIDIFKENYHDERRTGKA